MILVKNNDYGYEKSVLAVFIFHLKKKNVLLTKTNRRRLCYHQAEGVGRSKRSPEGSLDEKGGFEDQLLYPELKFGVEK